MTVCIYKHIINYNFKYLNIWAIHRVVSLATWAPKRIAWLLSSLANNADILWERIAARVTASVGNNGCSTLSQLGSVLITNSSKIFSMSSIELSSGSKNPTLVLRGFGFLSASGTSWALTTASRRPTTSETWNSSPPKGRRSW